MEGRFRVTFCDGSTELVIAESATAAKMKAKTARVFKLDPLASMPVTDRRSHGSVKVAKVEEAEERELERPRGVAGAPGVGNYLTAILVALAIGGALRVLDLALGGLLLGDGATGVVAAGVLSLQAYSGTAINTTIAALAAVTGDSLSIPHFAPGKRAWIIQAWNDVQAAGTMRVRSPKWHDNVNGIRIDTIASDPVALLPMGARQEIYSGETLVVELAGSATAGDVEFICLLRYFEELSAQHARLLSWEDVRRRMLNLLTVENTIATVATGIWGGSEAINAEIDQFQTGFDYAILGYVVDTECAAVAYQGPSFANERVGGPGFETQRDVTREWFVRLSQAHDLPLVPVFNANDKANTNVLALQDENGADTTVTTFLAQLRAA